MDELENKKNQAIQEVLHAVREQISKDGIIAGDMHFNKIQYIEKDESGVITVSYPMEKGTYHNYCLITIEPNGKTNIHGVQTSPERRSGVTKTHNGSFDINLNIENWSETENIATVTEEGYGKYNPEKGIFDDCSATRVDTEYMWKKIDQKFPSTCEEENIINDTNTYSWYGEGLPYVPCIEYFNDGTDLLIITPEYATNLLKKHMENQEKGGETETILYKDAMTGLSSDCFDISLDSLDIYVVENDGILEQSDEEKEQKYTEYKNTVLECIDKGIGFNYKGIVNEDLRKDQEFILRAEEILKRDKKEGYYEWTKDVRKQLGISRMQNPNKNLTYRIGDTQAFKDAIVDMTQGRNSINTESLKNVAKKVEDATIDRPEGEITQDVIE